MVLLPHGLKLKRKLAYHQIYLSVQQASGVLSLVAIHASLHTQMVITHRFIIAYGGSIAEGL